MCGYVNADAQELLPEEARAAGQKQQEEGVYLQMYGTVPHRTLGNLVLETAIRQVIKINHISFFHEVLKLFQVVDHF